MDKPYVYRISHISTGMFYIGVRYSINLKKKDLFDKYFTSSKLVKSIIQNEGISSFTIDFIEEYDTAEQAVEREHILIKETINDPMSMNGRITSNFVYKSIHRKIPDGSGLTSYQKGARKGVMTKMTNDPEFFVKKASNGLLKNPKENSRKAQLTINSKLIDGIPYRKFQSEKMRECNPMHKPDVRNKVSEKIIEFHKNETTLDKKIRLEKIKITKIINGDHEKHSVWMLKNNPTKNTVWVNNGKENKRILIIDGIPDGYVLGRVSFSIKRKEKTCPHCNLVGKGPNMARYHFNNCKKRYDNG